MRHALILAGGSGTRLWPFSTAALPKQLVPLLQGRSLLDIAVQRATAAVPADRVWLGVGQQLAGARVEGLDPSRIIVEPSGRDTLPAVALGCAVIAAEDPDAVVAVLTADHLIDPVAEFAATLEQAFALAEQRADALVTFGVVPDSPATGFGYLELGQPLSGPPQTDPAQAGSAPTAGPRVVSRFREKPDRARAEALVAEGALWNSGMFVWQAATLLRAVAQFSPATAAVVAQVAAGDPSGWEGAPKQSLDYGFMEPASASPEFTVAALPLRARWLDVGSWPAYGDALGRDTDGNAVGAARAVVLGSRDCVVASSDPEHLVALVGCEGLVVVHTPTATLVMPAAEAQRVKELHAQVAARFPELA